MRSALENARAGSKERTMRGRTAGPCPVPVGGTTASLGRVIWNGKSLKPPLI
jgi:hypothetical protein